MEAVSTKILAGGGDITVNSRLALADVRAFLMTPGVDGVDYLDAVGKITMHFDSAAELLRRIDMEEVKRDRFVGCDEPEPRACEGCDAITDPYEVCAECGSIVCFDCATDIGWELGSCPEHEVEVARRIQREQRTAYALLEGKIDQAAEILRYGLFGGDETERVSFALRYLRASAKDALGALGKATPVDKTRAA